MTDWKDIQVLALDVDGVMTRGYLTALSDGTLLRTYNSKDTFALRMAAMKGLRIAIVSGSRGQAIEKRFLALGVRPEDLCLNSHDKGRDLCDFCERNGYELSQVAFMGDDLPDLPALKLAGISICPSDAVPEVLGIVDHVTEERGGECSVRSVVKKILLAKGLWEFDPSQYKSVFSVTDVSK